MKSGLSPGDGKCVTDDEDDGGETQPDEGVAKHLTESRTHGKHQNDEPPLAEYLFQEDNSMSEAGGFSR